MSHNDENQLRKDVKAAAKLLPKSHVVDIVDELKSVLFLYPDLANRVVQKPYDLGINWQGHYVALELKKVKRAFSFRPHDLFEPPAKGQTESHQWLGLKEAAESGATAGMLVQFCFALTDKQKAKYNWPRYLLDLTFFISSDIIESLGLDYCFELDELREKHLQIEKTGGVYNLEPLWKNHFQSVTKRTS